MSYWTYIVAARKITEVSYIILRNGGLGKNPKEN